MGMTRKIRRANERHRRPDLDDLESRMLLTASPGPLGKRHGPAAVAQLDARPSPTDSSLNSAASLAVDAIGAARVRKEYGVDGKGMTVAVIDTGVNYAHKALGGGLGKGYKVVAGYDFADKDGDPAPTSQHGTAVAGLIASSDPGHPGVAPGAGLAALRVFSDDQQGDYKYVAQALEWVVDNHDTYRITAVNLSLADGKNYVRNWFDEDGKVGEKISKLIGKLDDLNIPVIAATGNSFNGNQGQGFPAIIPATISVTAVDSRNELSGDAQRLGADLGGASATDIAAPGEGLIAPVQGDDFASVGGTSFAAPQVTGAVVLLQQIYKARFGSLPTVDQVETWIKAGSGTAIDKVTKIAVGRLDIARAASLIPEAVKVSSKLGATATAKMDEAATTKSTTPPKATAPAAPAPVTKHVVTPEAQLIASTNLGVGSIVNATAIANEAAVRTASIPDPSRPVGPQPKEEPAQTIPSAGTLNVADKTDAGAPGTTVAVDVSTFGKASPEKPVGGPESVLSQINGAAKSLSGWLIATGGKVGIWTGSGDPVVPDDLGASHAAPAGHVKAIVHRVDRKRPRRGPGVSRGNSSFVRQSRLR